MIWLGVGGGGGGGEWGKEEDTGISIKGKHKTYWYPLLITFYCLLCLHIFYTGYSSPCFEDLTLQVLLVYSFAVTAF